MESSSKIEVYFRKKPFFSISNEDKDIINLTETSINIENCKPRVNKKQYFSSYKNLNILTDNLNNYEIYERTIKQDISNLKSNLLIAYGQTGSGKTHTLTGTNSEIGIIPIAIAQLPTLTLSEFPNSKKPIELIILCLILNNAKSFSG